MANVFIKRPGKDPFDFAKAQVVTAVKRGELLGDDEISADGKNWIRLDRHKQLGALFKTGASKPKTPTKPKKVNEAEFFSSDRVNCPKCGFDQDRADTCMECGIVFQKYFDSKKEARKWAESIAERNFSAACLKWPCHQRIVPDE